MDRLGSRVTRPSLVLLAKNEDIGKASVFRLGGEATRLHRINLDGCLHGRLFATSFWPNICLKFSLGFCGGLKVITKMKTTLLASSLCALLISSGWLLYLFWSDVSREFQFDAHHLRMDSPPILFIGLSFIAFQLSLNVSWRQRLKGILLGTAFAIWGSEPFMPQNCWLTLLDDLAMSIFVIDLGFIIIGEAKNKMFHPIRPHHASEN